MKKERYLTQKDASLLTRLVAHSHRMSADTHGAVNKLIELFTSCILLPENAERDDCVTLYSNVTYLPDGARDAMSLIIVLPHEANERIGHISILTPLALNFIGRVKNSIVELAFPFNQNQLVKIIDIESTQKSLITC